MRTRSETSFEYGGSVQLTEALVREMIAVAIEIVDLVKKLGPISS